MTNGNPGRFLPAVDTIANFEEFERDYAPLGLPRAALRCLACRWLPLRCSVVFSDVLADVPIIALARHHQAERWLST